MDGTDISPWAPSSQLGFKRLQLLLGLFDIVDRIADGLELLGVVGDLDAELQSAAVYSANALLWSSDFVRLGPTVQRDRLSSPLPRVQHFVRSSFGVTTRIRPPGPARVCQLAWLPSLPRRPRKAPRPWRPGRGLVGEALPPCASPCKGAHP